MLLTQSIPDADLDASPVAARGFAGGIDEFTLARARRGERAAFAGIYDRYAHACYNLALRLCGSASVAEDVVQEVFAKVLVRLAQVREGAVFGAWLKRICVNESIDWLRRRAGPEVTVDMDSVSLPAVEPDLVSRQDLWSVLMDLPDTQRSVLLLYEMEGYTHAEIAQLFGMSESFSKSLVARTLKRIRAVLEAENTES